jgi:hypothetical protein
MAVGNVVQSYFIRNAKRADLLIKPHPSVISELSGGADTAVNNLID